MKPVGDLLWLELVSLRAVLPLQIIVIDGRLTPINLWELISHERQW